MNSPHTVKDTYFTAPIFWCWTSSRPRKKKIWMTPKLRWCVGVYITALPSPTHLLEGLKCNKEVRSIFHFCGSLVINEEKGTTGNILKNLIAKNGSLWALIKTELSVEVFGCRPSVGRTRNSLEETARGGECCAKNSPFPLNHFCVFMHVYTQAWLLTWRTSGALKLPSAASVQKREGRGAREGGGLPSGLCGQLSSHRPLCQHVTREGRGCHTSHASWKERCVSLCHLRAAFVSWGARRAAGKGLREPPCLGMGACRCCVWSHCRAKVFHTYRKRRENSWGWQWLARCFVSAVNGRELITACTRPVRQLSLHPRGS